MQTWRLNNKSLNNQCIRENQKKTEVSGINGQWKHNITKLVRHNESNLRGKLVRAAHIKRIEEYQLNNLQIHRKVLGRLNDPNLKPKEGTKV